MSKTARQERIDHLDFCIETARLTVKKGVDVCPGCPKLPPEERCGQSCPIVTAFLIAEMEQEKQALKQG